MTGSEPPSTTWVGIATLAVNPGLIHLRCLGVITLELALLVTRTCLCGLRRWGRASTSTRRCQSGFSSGHNIFRDITSVVLEAKTNPLVV
jgi:hypothetical protein